MSKEQSLAIFSNIITNDWLDKTSRRIIGTTPSFFNYRAKANDFIKLLEEGEKEEWGKQTYAREEE